MGKKYIIELPENTHWIQWVMEGTKDHHPYMDFKQVEDLTPYTAPDLEQVRKEGYEKGKMDAYVEDSKNITVLKEEAEEAYEDGYKTAKVQCNIQAEKDLREVGERHYQKGLSDAWEAARKIIRMPEGDLLNLFTECYAAVCTSVQVFLKYDASECIEKIRAYEQEKEEIQVGDEVIIRDKTAVVTEITDRYVRIMYSDGSCYALFSKGIVKTGRHFPEIAEVLQKMKES